MCAMDDEGTDAEDVLERQLSAAVRMNLFDEQPPYLNAFFRFQLGSNTFDGEPVARKRDRGIHCYAKVPTTIYFGALLGEFLVNSPFLV